jgi:hypothetical protein
VPHLWFSLTIYTRSSVDISCSITSYWLGQGKIWFVFQYLLLYSTENISLFQIRIAITLLVDICNDLTRCAPCNSSAYPTCMQAQPIFANANSTQAWRIRAGSALCGFVGELFLTPALSTCALSKTGCCSAAVREIGSLHQWSNTNHERGQPA